MQKKVFRYISFMLSLILLGALAYVPKAVRADSWNIALNTVTTASACVSSSETPDKASDGSAATKWHASGSTNWLMADLGQNYSISRYTVRHAGAGGEPASLNTRDFKFQVSGDGTGWTDIDEITGNTGNVTDRIVDTSGRYVRLYVTNPQTAADNIAARIYEFEVYSGTNLSVSDGTRWLADNMDQYSRTIDVYTDAYTAGNHFDQRGAIMPDAGPVPEIMDEEWHTGVHSGVDCIKCTYNPYRTDANSWEGWYFLNGTLTGGQRTPRTNWGDTPGAGVDLTGVTSLTFWAKGEAGGEVVKFFCFGAGWDSDKPYKDSSDKIESGYKTLTQAWQKYTVAIPAGADTSYVLGGFGWCADDIYNSSAITFYLDDIQFNCNDILKSKRLNSPRFMRSYTTGIPGAPTADQPFGMDTVMRNTAFIYDNSMAILSFLAVGENTRAKLLADALVYAQSHDRAYTGGPLRNAYMAGDLSLPAGWIPNGLAGRVKTSGWWGSPDIAAGGADSDDAASQNGFSWYEDKYSLSINTGNMAWAMLGLLSYYQTCGGRQYLDAAASMGDWIDANMKCSTPLGGYFGGYEGWEDPENPGNLPGNKLVYRSTEHNLDLYAAFTRLYNITGDSRWNARAAACKSFVLAMWDGTGKKFWTGTDPDAYHDIINTVQVPLDMQAWTLLSLRDQLPAGCWEGLQYAEIHQKYKDTWGFDFDGDTIPSGDNPPVFSAADGIWFEGTGQMAAAYRLTGQAEKAGNVIAVINANRHTAGTNGLAAGALNAASRDELTTGYNVTEGVPWYYYMRESVGATAWGVMALKGKNAFWIGTPYENIAPLGTAAFEVPDGCSMDSIADGQYFTGTVNVSGRARDPGGVSGVQVLLDGTILPDTVGYYAPGSLYNCILDISTLAGGPHTIAVRATRPDRSVFESAAKTINVINVSDSEKYLITYTGVPPCGTLGEAPVNGTVNVDDAADYDVYVYIHVPGWGWVSKPYAIERTADMDIPNKTWSCITNTGGSDYNADEILAFLYRKDSSNLPPLKMQGEYFEDSIKTNAEAWVQAVRHTDGTVETCYWEDLTRID